jgi:hypothetical protein
MTRLRLACLVLSAVGLSACGDDTPTSPSQSAGGFSQFYIGTMAPGGSGFFSFAVASKGQLSLTLASVSSPGGHPAVPARMRLGYGVPSGTGCALTASVVVGARLDPQIVTPIEAGTYCAQLSDAGELSGAVEFAVRIVYPDVPILQGTAGTIAFSSTLGVAGAATRAFTAAETGQVRVTLTAVGTSRVGLGVGIPRFDGSGCLLAQSIETSGGAAAQISLQVDVGTYCVKVFDVGTLTTPVGFALSIVHP